MGLIAYLSVMLPLLVWCAGEISLYSEIVDDIYLKFIAANFFLIISMSYIWKIEFRSAKLAFKTTHGSRSFKSINFLVFTVAVLAATMYVELYKTGLSSSFDDARFVVRASPFFGFASRVTYWWPIVLMPYLVYSYQVDMRRSTLFAIFVLLASSMASGSKAGVVWLVVSMIFTARVLGVSGYVTKRIDRLLWTAMLIAVLGLVALFYVLSDDWESALGGFIFRVGFGAVEGLQFALDYKLRNQITFPYFSIYRPLELLGATFRIIEKNYYTGDTGVYLARYFGRENDNASYTISAPGLFYMEGGVLEMVIGSFLLSAIFYFIIKKMNSEKNIFLRLSFVSWLIVFLHFLDWGWMDGIIVFSILYVMTAHFFIKIIRMLSLKKTSIRSKL